MAPVNEKVLNSSGEFVLANKKGLPEVEAETNGNGTSNGNSKR